MYKIDLDKEGHPITFEGIELDKETLITHLNELSEAVAFYADPETYHAISFISDSPCGEFSNDLSNNNYYDYPKPGKLGRYVLNKLYTKIIRERDKR